MLDQIMQQLRDPDRHVAETAARALKHTAEQDPAALHAIHKQILRAAQATPDLRVRWNLLVVVGHLRLSGRERLAAVDWLLERLEDASPFSRTFALQALWNLSQADPPLRARVVKIAQRFADEGTAAMRARARRLLQDA